MSHKYASFLTLMAVVGFLPMLETQAGEPPAYQVYAVRYATLSGFPVSALVQGAERDRKLDIAMTIWVLKEFRSPRPSTRNQTWRHKTA